MFIHQLKGDFNDVVRVFICYSCMDFPVNLINCFLLIQDIIKALKLLSLL